MLSKLRIFAVCAALIFTLALTPFRPLKVTGHSMDPTLRDGDTYLLDHMYWKGNGLRRNDIVVVRRGAESWVKRLVGMPGDRLLIRYLPDGLIEEVVNLTLHPEAERTTGIGMIRVVQPDEVFVMGDNVNHSADSTTQRPGAFRLRDVVGVVRTLSLARDIPMRHVSARASDGP